MHGQVNAGRSQTTGPPRLPFLNSPSSPKRAELDPTKWHVHCRRDTAATRWLRAVIDVRTVQEWLGHESLATTQKYLKPSKETEKQLEAMKLPF
jgi:site-specific recombinase XerD